MILLVACGAPIPQGRPAEGFLDGADGHSLFYRLRAAGPDTIVIVHGFQGNSQNYLAADLEAVIVEPTLLFYDQRGGGRSAPVSESAAPGLAEHVRDLEAVRTAMGFLQLTLLGHSGGALIAAQYALQFPERVDRLILVAPGPPAQDPFAAQTVAAFGARLDSATWVQVNTLQASMLTAADPVSVCHEIASITLPGAFLANPSAVETMEGDFCAAPADILRTESIRLSAFQESLGNRDWRRQLASLETPVLIIHGDQDAIPRSAAEEWERSLPNAQLVVIPEADHLPWLDQPRPFAAAVSEFLKAIRLEAPLRTYGLQRP